MIPKPSPIELLEPSVEQVISAVSVATGLPVAAIKNTRNRLPIVSRARAIAWYVARHRATMIGRPRAWSDIGSHFGCGDHSSPVVAFHKMEREIEKNKPLRRAIAAVEAEIVKLMEAPTK